MKLQFLILLLFYPLFSFTQCKLDYSGWGTPVFEDDFNYTSISELSPKWLFEYYGGIRTLNYDSEWGNIEDELYFPDQFELPGDGTVKIIAEKLDTQEPYFWDGNFLGFYHYHSGLLRANYANNACSGYGQTHGFNYGLYEIRCKMPSQSGMWAAFWLQWGPTEFDIVELFNEETFTARRFLSNVFNHNESYSSSVNFLYGADDDLSDDFHTYSLVWIPAIGANPPQATFFFDGYELYTVRAPEVPGNVCPLDMHINLAVHRDNDPADYGDFIIDYVRVYQKTDYSAPYKEEETYMSAPLDYSFNPGRAAFNGKNTIAVNSNDTRVYYRGIDNKMHLYTWLNATNSWQNSLLYLADVSEDQKISGDIVASGTNTVFYRGEDEYLQSYSKVDGAWKHTFLGVSDSDPLTHRVSSSNKSISMGPDGNVYYRGADNKIHRYYYTDGIWEHEWIDNTVPTLERVSGDIAVAPDGKIFYRGNDGFIQYYSFNGTIWQHFWIESNTADVSTKISSEPNSLAISNDNKVCYRGSNNKIHRYINSGDAYVHSQITVPFVDYQVKGNLQLGNNGEIYFLNDENYIRYVKPGLVVWKMYEIENKTWYDPRISPYFTAAGVGNKIYWRHEDGDIFNYYFDVCENLNPVEQTWICEPYCEPIFKHANTSFNKDLQIEIYPNPSSNFLNVEFAQLMPEMIVNIYGLNGEKIYSLSYNNIYNLTIDVSAISNGVYFIEFITNENTIVKKFIKE